MKRKQILIITSLLFVFFVLFLFAKFMSPPGISPFILAASGFFPVLALLFIVFRFKENFQQRARYLNLFIGVCFVLSCIASVFYYNLYTNQVACLNNEYDPANCVCFPLTLDHKLNSLVQKAGGKKAALELYNIDYIKGQISNSVNSKSILFTKLIFIGAFSALFISVFSFLTLVYIGYNNNKIENKIKTGEAVFSSDKVPPVSHTDFFKNVGRPLNLFISYAREDVAYKETFWKQLAALRRTGKLNIWADNQILPGVEWDETIRSNLRQADIIALLVSDDFMNSDYIWDVEIKESFERRKKGEAVIILPVYIRPCVIDGTFLSSIQGLPRDGKPVTVHSSQDEAWFHIVTEIQKITQEFGATIAAVKSSIIQSGSSGIGTLNLGKSNIVSDGVVIVGGGGNQNDSA